MPGINAVSYTHLDVYKRQDCNCASAGSVIGAVLGSKNIPDKWKLPLNDTICSGVDGIGKIKISEAAQRTLELIE